MEKSLNTTLQALKVARISLRRPSTQRKTLLFMEKGAEGLEFNGYDTLQAYRTSLMSLYADCKIAVNSQVNARSNTEPLELLRELSMLHFDVKDFKRLYFPKGNELFPLSRVEMDKSAAIAAEDETLRQTILRYLEEQANLLLILEKLYKHRIKHLNAYYADNHNKTTSHRKPLATREQLALFPEESPITLLRWNGKRVDFAELFDSVFESGSVAMMGEGTPNREEYFELLQWFFNFKFDNVGPLIRSAKKRKKENTPFLLKLMGIFKGTSSLEL
jgi:hypothetical protein